MKQQTRRIDLAYPKSEVKTANEYFIQLFCGGAGGGDCIPVLGYEQFVYPIRVSRSTVFNRSLILHNPEFTGVDVFSNGGAVGICPASADERQPWWLAFSVNGVLTAGQILAQGMEFDQEPGFDIEVGWDKLPQPVLPGGGVNPLWERRIYVHIYWGDAGFVSPSSYLINQIEGVLQVVKHDQDIKP